MKYRFLEHTADIKFIVHGKKMSDIFENSVLAISDFVSKGAKINNILSRRFKISGRDYEELLYNFIDEIIYFIDAENFIPCEAEVHLEKSRDRIVLKAILLGDKSENYENLSHIKAATYSEMYIKENKEKKRWEAQAVIDV